MYNFKNYNNREIEVPGNKEQAYEDAGYNRLNVINNMTLWNPNDGINTTITTTWFTTTIPNYVIVTPTDDNTIESRWWVVKHERIAGSQHRLYLYRDLIADNIKMILNNSYSYILRGYCSETLNQIYNSEDITFNQIKSEQYPLYDSTYCPWIVLYLKVPGLYNPDEIKTKTITTVSDNDQVTTMESATDVNPGKTFVNWAAQENTRWYGVNEVVANTYYYALGIRWQDAHPTETPTSGVLKAPDGLPYVVLTIPYSDFTFVNMSGSSYSITKSEALKIASMVQQIYGEWVMDVQIVPFCPLRFQSHDTSYKPVVDVRKYNDRFLTVNKLKRTSDTGSSQIEYYCGLIQADMYSATDISLYTWYNSNYPTTASVSVTDIKAMNCTETYRLCSPNGSSVFEFNPAQMVESNYKNVTFKADFTYQPYNCYINIKPNFKRLYGGSYIDYRGLNASGDYSIPQNTDAWISYVQNNKNYVASFKNEISLLQTQNTMQNVSGYVGIASGAATGAASGAVVGSVIPGLGTVAGAVVGGVIGGISSAVDAGTGHYERWKTLNTTIKNHNLALKNISAQPTTISNVNTFNVDNLFVPILERYKCSDEELTRFNNYIKHSGYNISDYGKPATYMKKDELWFYSFVVERLDGFIGDGAMLNQLKTECSQGFYYNYGG